MFAETALTNSVGSGAKQEENYLSCSLSLASESTGAAEGGNCKGGVGDKQNLGCLSP